MIDLDRFTALANQGYTHIPLVQTLHIPQLDPLAVYIALGDQGDDYLFEKRGHRPRAGTPLAPELSVIGLTAMARFEIHGKQLRVIHIGQAPLDKFDADPLTLLQRELASYRVPNLPDMPAFSGGFFGYFGFDTTRLIEPRLARSPAKPRPVALPDVVQLVSRDLIVFEHQKGTIQVIVHAIVPLDGQGRSIEASYLEAQQALQALCGKIITLRPRPTPSTTSNPAAPAPNPDPASAFGAMQHSFARSDFLGAVNRIKAYIQAGDVMQVVLSQHMSRPFTASPVAYYRHLTAFGATPYSYLVNLGQAHIVGVSPEILVRQQADVLTSRPMAGTRRRGASPDEDTALQNELLADPKELAEHMMLVDLARNDLGRLARVGSVKVEALLSVEHYSHVMHLVSTVTGRRSRGGDGIDALRATFPAGTLSGASKVRALEVIDELEPHGRGVYGGAVGYLGWHGDTELAIAIRTAVIANGVLHLQAGAGVVHDSVAEHEWQETLDKARALVLAAQTVEDATTNTI